ncbi:MAG: heparinase II/III family protein [Opitutales bacterium]
MHCLSPKHYYLIFLACVFAFAAPALAESSDPLENLKPTHPRILIDANHWSAIKAQAETDPLLAKFLATALLEAERLSELPPVERKQQGRRLLAVSREALGRISLWAMARHLQNDLRYAKRAEEEMLTIVKFSDWNPSHFLDVAEMTAALAIGYDWLYHDLDPQARETIREGIVRLGLKPGVKAVRNKAWWTTYKNNWNQVCLGGLTIGALAVADDTPELAREILRAARSGISNGLSVYAPDGVYPEGPGYWSYGTIYQCLMIDTVRSALGTSWEMEKAPGFLQSARTQVKLAGPSGRFFNFADGREGPSLQTSLFWFARELNEPSLLHGQSALLEKTLENPSFKWLSILPALWWPEAFTTTPPTSLPLAWQGEGPNPVAIFRSSWSDPDALYLACKGGSANVSHAHMDAGSFVLEADGVRWAVDLGLQGYYDLESKGILLWDKGQGGNRWDVFRLNNRSHNTLTINDQLHRVNGVATFTHFDAQAKTAELDLSAIFRGQAKKASRRFEVSGRDALITDHLQGLKPDAQVRWTMATRAQVEIEGSRATLQQEGKRLEVTMQAPGHGQLQVIPADPPDDGFNAPNPDTYLLIVDATAPASGELTIQMHFNTD